MYESPWISYEVRRVTFTVHRTRTHKYARVKEARSTNMPVVACSGERIWAIHDDNYVCCMVPRTYVRTWLGGANFTIDWLRIAFIFYATTINKTAYEFTHTID